MNSNVSRTVLVAASLLGLLGLGGLAYFRPGYFTNQTYIAALIGLELLVLAVWRFRQVFFVLLMYAFLSAGSALPGNSVGTKARWIFLGIGALAGTVIMLKEGRLRFGFFHLASLSCVLAALISAAVSRYPDLAVLKAVSLFLLFLYAATGARIAVDGRETRFLNGLVTGCEILVGATALCYAAGIELLGNPNSLGALMAVVATPVLLWGILASNEISKSTFTRRRRMVMFLGCVYLVYYSHARAAMLAAMFSSALLCVAVREYKMLVKGFGVVLILFAAATILRPQAVSTSVSSFTSDVVYKGHEPNLLGSRESPWNEAMAAIGGHFWFGTGFGTVDAPSDGTVSAGNFASNFAVTAEYGNSYLAVVAWVGVIGTVPFLLLLAGVVGKIVATFRWMRATGSVLHPAVPLTLVVVAGLVHAGLEDWLFAVGYYLCVFFWSMAFVLVDIAPAPARVPAFSLPGRFHPTHGERQVLVAGR